MTDIDPVGGEDAAAVVVARAHVAPTDSGEEMLDSEKRWVLHPGVADTKPCVTLPRLATWMP